MKLNEAKEIKENSKLDVSSLILVFECTGHDIDINRELLCFRHYVNHGSITTFDVQILVQKNKTCYFISLFLTRINTILLTIYNRSLIITYIYIYMILILVSLNHLRFLNLIHYHLRNTIAHTFSNNKVNITFSFNLNIQCLFATSTAANLLACWRWIEGHINIFDLTKINVVHLVLVAAAEA